MTGPALGRKAPRTGRPGARRDTRATRAAWAGFLGGALEYYDFGIYLTASALIFSRVLFSTDGASAVLLSIGSFGLAYLARPIGALVLGQLGDRIGRKRVLLACLVSMGASTFLIGCLPTYSVAGAAAPAALVVLRLVQGISAGGEIAGSSVLIVEHAPDGRRGLFGAWAINGPIAGFVLSNTVFVAVTALPDEVLYTWGWRIPFWLSLLVLVVAYLVRRTIEEPEVFVASARDRPATLPLVELVRHHLGAVLRLTGCALFTVVNTVVAVFGLAYATGTAGLSPSFMLLVSIVANVVAIPVQTLGGHLSDRIGRRPVMITGSAGCAVGIFGYFAAIAAHQPALVLLAAIVLTGGFYSLANGVYPAFFVEMFDVRVRYTGTAIGLQISQLVAGFAPLAATALAGGHGAWTPAAILTAAVCLVAVVATRTARETAREPLRDLGAR